MRKCPFCYKLVGKDPHIYFCENRTTDNKTEIKFLYISKNFPLISSKDDIIYNYIDNIKSLPDIKNEFGIDSKSFTFLLDYYKIEIRSISTSSKLISVNKYKKTCNLKYGVDNVSKFKDIKELKKKTFIKNYGVDNIFKDKEFKKWILENNFAWNNLTEEQNKERNEKQTISIKKYWENLTDEQKNKLFRYNGTSKLESKISDTLNDMCISYTTQFPLKGKLFDFRILNTNILIEVNGDYWHCNPNKYKLNEIVKFPGGNKKVIDIWNKDNKKREIAEKDGYKVIYIWEEEMKGNLSSLLLSKLNI
jgi:very-short-patch-repair endonuclease